MNRCTQLGDILREYVYLDTARTLLNFKVKVIFRQRTKVYQLLHARVFRQLLEPY